MCCITVHKTPFMYTHFSEWVVSSHSLTTEATRGCGSVSQFFFSRLSSMSVLNILQISIRYIQTRRESVARHFHIPPPRPPVAVLRQRVWPRTSNFYAACVLTVKLIYFHIIKLWRLHLLSLLLLLLFSLLSEEARNAYWILQGNLLYKVQMQDQTTRWFKYDWDWFVCKQAALRSSCATLRESSHNLHPPSCSC